MPGALLGPFGRYELGTELVTIGRSSTNKLIINDNQVSGRHLQIIPQGTGYVLVDVGSSNGTVFNGQRLSPQTPQALRHGDVIVIGTTQMSVELTAGAFPAAPQQAAPAQPVFAPSEQMGCAPAQVDPFPAFAAPVQPAPNYGPPAQQGAPFQPAAPPPGAFGAYQGYPPGQAQGYYPGASPYQGAPAGAPPARAGRKRLFLVLGGVLAVLILLGGTGLAIFLLSHRAAPGPSIPDATAQVVTPFYNALKGQNYTKATGFFTAEYLQQLGGQQQAVTLFQQFDQLRGTMTAYSVVSVKPVNGSTTNEQATVKVTRDPSKGTFNPDTLQLIYRQGKWQISQWTPGQRQS
jgi:hypothetical protein